MRTFVLILHIVTLTLAFGYGAFLSAFGIFLTGISFSFWNGPFADSLLTAVFSVATVVTGFAVCALSARRIAEANHIQETRRERAVSKPE